MIDRKALKADARAAIKAARPHPALVALAVLVILAVLAFLYLRLTGWTDAFVTLLGNLSRGDLTVPEVRGTSGFFGALLTFALLVMIAMMLLGFMLYGLRVHRREPASVGDVFDAFTVFLRGVFLALMKYLLIALCLYLYIFAISFVTTAAMLYVGAGDELLAQTGMEEYAELFDAYAASLSPEAVDTILTVVTYAAPILALPALLPALLTAASYSMAGCILLDHREFGAFQSLALSRMAMRSRRWEYLRLHLSFLGWYALCLIPFAAAWVLPYVTVTKAAYYESVVPAYIREIERQLRQPPAGGPGAGTPGTGGPDTAPKPPERPKPPASNGGYSVPGEPREDDSGRGE